MALQQYFIYVVRNISAVGGNCSYQRKPPTLVRR